MVDVHDVIRDYLLTQSALTAQVGARIYAGRDVPPKAYQLSDGACVTFRVRGGNEDYEGALARPSVQFKCYGASEYQAGVVAQLLDDALHEGRDTSVLYAQREMLPQPLEEPNTEWRYALVFYQFLIRQ